MKYFLDTEFLEGPQDKKLFGFNIGKTKPTIDFISIGLVAEDGREYYAISKDFNLWESWNRFDIEKKWESIYDGRLVKSQIEVETKVYWIRENVLRPIFQDLLSFFNPVKHDIFDSRLKEFTYSNFKKLLSLYGKTNKEISKEIIDFVYSCEYPGAESETQKAFVRCGKINPEFYTYYGAYDWVVFCWLFGKMIDLPKGFPMYSRDLKQILDEKQKTKFGLSEKNGKLVNDIKQLPNYPKQINEHNALADARWNKKLYHFLESL